MNNDNVSHRIVLPLPDVEPNNGLPDTALYPVYILFYAVSISAGTVACNPAAGNVMPLRVQRRIPPELLCDELARAVGRVQGVIGRGRVESPNGQGGAAPVVFRVASRAARAWITLAEVTAGNPKI